MRKIILVCVLIIICLSYSVGQGSNDTITLRKAFGGYQFYQNNNKLNMSQLVNVMKPDEEAYKEIKAAQSSYTLASIIGGAGGFLVGWPLGTAISGGEANWTLAGIGAGLIVVSIPFTSSCNKHTKNAITTYNKGLRQTGMNKTDLRLGMTYNRIGIRMRF